MIVITARGPGEDGTPGAGPEQEYTLVPGESMAQTVAGWRYLAEPAGYVFVSAEDTEAAQVGSTQPPYIELPPPYIELPPLPPGGVTYSEETPEVNYLPFIIGGLVLLLLLRPSRPSGAA